MANKEIKLYLIIGGAVAVIANFISMAVTGTWYPVAFVFAVIMIIASFFVSKKEPKKKRKVSELEMEKLPFEIEPFIPENKPHAATNFTCNWTGLVFSGLPVTYQDYKSDRKDGYCTYNPIGQICSNCGSVSSENAKKSGMAFSDWDEYDSVKCNACQNDDIEPIIILDCN